MHSTNGYSQAVRLGELIFVSGQVALDATGQLVGAGDVRAQTAQAFANMRAVLESVGSGLECVGKITIYTTKVEYRAGIAEVRDQLFAKVGHFPASTYVVISALVGVDWLVEIEAVAAAFVPNDRR